jgi:dihydroflavonol-4-reductase
VHVDDVATGHLLAMEKGAPGESYILAGEVATFASALTTLAQMSDGRKPIFLPKWLVRTAARMNGGLERVVKLPQDQTREAMMASTATYYATSGKAQRELGWTPRPLREGFAETYLTPTG